MSLFSANFKENYFSESFLGICIYFLYYEKFYIAIENSQNSCALNPLCRSSFKRMTACGLFYIDTAPPLSLIRLITSYTSILIQFALYKKLKDLLLMNKILDRYSTNLSVVLPACRSVISNWQSIKYSIV